MIIDFVASNVNEWVFRPILEVGIDLRKKTAKNSLKIEGKGGFTINIRDISFQVQEFWLKNLRPLLARWSNGRSLNS